MCQPARVTVASVGAVATFAGAVAASIEAISAEIRFDHLNHV